MVIDRLDVVVYLKSPPQLTVHLIPAVKELNNRFEWTGRVNKRGNKRLCEIGKESLKKLLEEVMQLYHAKCATAFS